MLKEYLKKQTDACLWGLLADVGNILANKDDKAINRDFWLSLASDIDREIDTRLINDYEK